MHVTDRRLEVTTSGEQFETRVAWPFVFSDPHSRRVIIRRQLAVGNVLIPFGSFVLMLVEGPLKRPVVVKRVMALPPADDTSALEAARALLDGA